MNPRQRRAVLLLALAAAGLLGVFALVANYVSDVDTQVGPKIAVLELTRNVNAHEAIRDDMVRDVQVPRRWAPEAAFTDRTQIVGQVAGSDLQANSILQEGMLEAPPQLGPGERELAILVDASTGVAGKVQPNDHVDIIAAYAGENSAQTAATGKRPRPNRTLIVVSGARVIDVGTPRVKAGNGVQDPQRDPSQVVPVTFALTKRQELRVSHAQTFAQDVRLGLLREGDSTDRTGPETIYKGQDPKTGKDVQR